MRDGCDESIFSVYLLDSVVSCGLTPQRWPCPKKWESLLDDLCPYGCLRYWPARLSNLLEPDILDPTLFALNMSSTFFPKLSPNNLSVTGCSFEHNPRNSSFLSG